MPIFLIFLNKDFLILLGENMKHIITYLLSFLLLLSMVSAVDIYFIVDDAGTVEDVMVLQGATAVVPTKGFTVLSKMNSEVSETDLDDACMSVFIYKGVALIATSSICEKIAEDVQDYLEGEGISVTYKSTHEIESDDLKEELDEVPEPDCYEGDELVIYGNEEFTDECIGDTAYRYSCDVDEFIIDEEECEFGCEN